MKKRLTHSTRSLIALTLLACLGAPPAFAQDREEMADLEEVTVTASRLRQVTGYEAPTPVTMLTAEDMAARGSTNIADLINEVPSFTQSLTPQATNLNSRQNGRNGLDVRGLGPNRNLVLVNGRRFVPFDENGIVDVNAIPSVAIERVEIVTGGGSAAWGSDAVSGVVNIIFDDDLEGGKVHAQYGESTHGDSENYRISAAFGQHFAEERGHFMIAAERFDTKGIPEARARGWALEHWGFLSNPANTGPNDGIPAFRFAPNANLVLSSPNGITIPAGFSTDNIEFRPGGGWGPRDLGIPGGSLQEGGSGSFLPDRSAISIPNERTAVFGTMSYEFSDNARFFAEASYTEAESLGRLVDAFILGILIFPDNAFLPSDLAAQMTANSEPFLVLGRSIEEFPPSGSDSRNTNKRVVAGFEGEFGANERWWYEVYAQYGENRFRQNYVDLWFNNALMTQAADAVIDPGTGEVICRANAGGANGAPGCVPINLFGAGSPSQAALDYIRSPTPFSITKIKQTVLSATAGGELFEGWAGPISAAFGAEYRDESLDRVVDDRSQNNDWRIINAHNLAGDFDVTEGFAEVNVPLIPGDMNLDLNAAARYADYSTVGGTFSWKTGLVFQPVDAFRIRASISQDIRAPAIGEIFLEQLLLFGNVANPFTGNSEFHEIFFTGNENLKEERSITKTVGFVWSPETMDFQFSIDWYNIDFKDGIGNITSQAVLDRCFAGEQNFCDLITFNPDMSVVRFINTNLNLGTLEFEGLDIAASYAIEVGPGTFGVNLLANHRIKQLIAPSGGEPLDVAGEVGGWNTVGAPEWRGTLRANYDLENWGMFAQLRYIDGGKYNIAFGPEDLSDADNSISSRTYVDLSAYYNFKVGSLDYVQVYAGISNLFDRDPPVAPLNFISNYGTNSGLYELIGRQYYAGVRLEF